MQDKIDATVNGLQKMVSEIVRRKIDPRYAVCCSSARLG